MPGLLLGDQAATGDRLHQAAAEQRVGLQHGADLTANTVEPQAVQRFAVVSDVPILRRCKAQEKPHKC